jgi:hypothetical protein
VKKAKISGNGWRNQAQSKKAAVMALKINEMSKRGGMAASAKWRRWQLWRNGENVWRSGVKRKRNGRRRQQRRQSSGSWRLAARNGSGISGGGAMA